MLWRWSIFVGLFGCGASAIDPVVTLAKPLANANAAEPSLMRRDIVAKDVEGEEPCFGAIIVDADLVLSPLPDDSCFDSLLVPVEVCEFRVIERYYTEGRIGIAGPLFRELALRAPGTESGADAADRVVEAVSKVIALRPERRDACGRELTSTLGEVRPIVCASPLPRAKEHCDRYDAALAAFWRPR